tara:strand:- start:15838 stop:16026 length:189 start_codon:yes stop_codon:yes gene_type:complete
MKWIINEFKEWKDKEGDCSLGKNVGYGYGTFYEVVTDDYEESYDIYKHKSMAIEIKNELNKG